MWNIWSSEWRMTSRGRSYYSIAILWIVVISLLLALERTNGAISGYTNITGTVVNIMLYILPLFMLIFGSFSIANEMENGQWRLLCTYPLDIVSYFFGKLGGQFTAQAVCFSLAYWLSMVIGLLTGIDISLTWMLVLFLFSMLLILFFLTLGLFIGSFVSTKWQALTLSVAVWFLLIMIWPTALIAILGALPYSMIGVLMKIAMIINPAEFLRFFLVIRLDGGSIFGQAYDGLVPLFNEGIVWGVLFLYAFVFIAALGFIAIWYLKRRRAQ
ncbi:ABC transporter permease subunit [Pradoshia sp. D12]|uniref:ABC transporter permease n=1 Tax=Bacillaceae TaxID=186817 RepID=UPI00080AC6FA|nr:MULTISPECIES: ABC transporter permease subunit [Bacillaceae]OCA89826.1 ABC transporter permease [Bacillus sp. FJAT-27986]QFK70778.1 ABC transporter permease subunit [Pradoshia sp. D12]TPF72569.1 ABC transporter permease [Bacillus sp. D12]